MISSLKNVSEPRRQYIPIIAIIGGVVDDMYRNHALYSSIYNETLNTYGLNGIVAPLLVVNTTNDLLEYLKSATRQIRSIVNNVCAKETDPVNSCNAKMSEVAHKNKIFVKEAKILSQIAKISNMYIEQLEDEFNMAANSGDYLGRIIKLSRTSSLSA